VQPNKDNKRLSASAFPGNYEGGFYYFVDGSEDGTRPALRVSLSRLVIERDSATRPAQGLFFLWARLTEDESGLASRITPSHRSRSAVILGG
jgi:hypothetical protein